MVDRVLRNTPVLLLSFFAIVSCASPRQVIVDPATAGSARPQPIEDPTEPAGLPADSDQDETGTRDPVDDSRAADDPEPGDHTSTATPSTRATNTPDASTDIEGYLNSLSLRQRIGQRFIAFVPGNSVREGADELIRQGTPAGFVLYPRNYESAEEVRVLTRTLQRHAAWATPGISLFVAVDQEGGRVQAMEFEEFASIPSAHVLGRLRDPELVRAASYVTSRLLIDLGVNMNLAPVLDLHARGDDSIIGDRSFGDDPHFVSSLVRPLLWGSEAAGVISVAKHFPGHGITRVDSHRRLPIVQSTREELFSRDMIPFRTAVETGVPAIMTAHLLFEEIDPFFPVTISRVFLHDILRDELGFEGVVMTDGLEMWAMSRYYDIEMTLERLFRYDVDIILLYSRYDLVEMIDLVEELIREGRITEDDVNRGVRRVLSLKRDYGLLAPRLQ